jgi:hypothetical protein
VAVTTRNPWREIEDAVRTGYGLELSHSALVELLADHDDLVREKNALVGRNWRYRRIARAVHGEPEELAHIRRRDFIRSDKGCVCPACLNEYVDHPRDPVDGFLVVLCDMTRVKL